MHFFQRQCKLIYIENIEEFYVDHMHWQYILFIDIRIHITKFTFP